MKNIFYFDSDEKINEYINFIYSFNGTDFFRRAIAKADIDILDIITESGTVTNDKLLDSYLKSKKRFYTSKFHNSFYSHWYNKNIFPIADRIVIYLFGMDFFLNARFGVLYAPSLDGKHKRMFLEIESITKHITLCNSNEYRKKLYLPSIFNKPDINLAFASDLLVINWINSKLHEIENTDEVENNTTDTSTKPKFDISILRKRTDSNTFNIKKYPTEYSKPKTDLQRNTVIYLFRLLQRSNLITSDIDNKDLGMIVEILTGLSANKIAQYYSDKDTFLNISKEEKEKLKNRLKLCLENLENNKI